MAEPAASTVTVTSENLAQFNATRLGMADVGKTEPEVKPEPKTEEQTELELETPEKPEDHTKKGKQPIGERFSEITAQRRAAIERAEAAERERDELRARLTPPPPPPPQPVVDTAKPKASDYSDAFQYAEALADWKFDQKWSEVERKEAEKAAQAQAEKARTTFSERVAQVKAEVPDYDKILKESDVAVSDPVRDAIIKNPQGPRILLKLAQEPELAKSLEKMDVLDQLMTIGEIAADLRRPPLAAAPPPPVARAPAPITPVRGNKTADVPIDSDGEFHGTPSQWKALRKAGKIN